MFTDKDKKLISDFITMMASKIPEVKKIHENHYPFWHIDIYGDKTGSANLILGDCFVDIRNFDDGSMYNFADTTRFISDGDELEFYNE